MTTHPIIQSTVAGRTALLSTNIRKEKLGL